MSVQDKNIVITPNIGSATDDPKIVFSGADASTGAQNITLKAYPTSSGTLSFEGSAGQLFSITNSLSGTIYSVNDVSGIPSIEVLDTGLVKLAQYSGNVLLGTGTDNGSKLQVQGTIRNQSVWINNGVSYNDYNENIRLFDAPNGISTIGFGSTGINGAPRLSLVGYSDHMSHRFNGTEYIGMYNGYTLLSGSARAPLFYDSDNTGYYLDPNGNSNLYSVVLNSVSQISYQAAINTTTPGNANYGLHFTGQTTADYASGITWNGGTGTIYAQAGIYVQGSGNYGTRMYIATTDSYATGSRTALYINESGTVYTQRSFLQATGSLRAPVFYDSDNTGYYVDPLSTSVLNAVQASTVQAAGGDFAIKNNTSSSASAWHNRTGVVNASNDRSVFVGTYGSNAIVGAHNSALTAWAELYINNVDGSSGGSVRLPTYTYVAGNQVIHAGNYTSYKPPLLAPTNVTSTAASVWNPQSLTYQAWGQAFTHTSISSDSGDITLWLRASQYLAGGTELCMVIDGDYYAGTGANKVLHAGNYGSYAIPWSSSSQSGVWMFNNMGNGHSTYTDFNSVPGFGPYYVQNGTNSPTGTAGHQWYGFTLGLGIDYPIAQYGTQFYWPRAAQNSDTYTYVRDKEGGTWGSWRKTKSGYADSAGNADTVDGWHRDDLRSFGNLILNQWNSSTYVGYSTIYSTVFYDSNDSTYYFDGTGGTRQSKYLTINGNTGGNYGNELVVGNTAVQYSLEDTNLRPIIQATGAYPCLSLNHTVTSNGSHGPTVQFTANGTGNQFVIGMSGNGTRLDIGTSSSTNWNPHNGIDNYTGTTGIRMDTSGIVYNFVQTRSPIYYDYNDTGYYCDPNSTSQFAQVNISGTNSLYFSSYGGGWFCSDGSWLRSVNSFSTWLGSGNYGTNGSISTGFGGNMPAGTGGIAASSNIRAPIFYDSDSTGYYCDPNGTSNLIRVYAANSGNQFGQVFRKTGNPDTNGANILVQNDYGSHSWGITGEFRVDAASGDRPSILFSNGGDTNTWTIGYGYTDTSYFRINRDHGHRNTSWGTTLMTMDRSGNVTFAGNVTAYSDERIKKNIRKIADPLSIVGQLDGVTFDYIDDDRPGLGVIAQQVEKVLPMLVSETPSSNGEVYKNVAYGNMVGLLIEAIKEQQATIESQNERIARLESLINKLI